MATEVERLLDSMQTGEYIPEEELDYQDFEPINQNPVQRPGLGFRNLRLNPNGEMRNDVLGFEAAAAGYGNSRYDTGEFVQDADLETKRAIDQPGFWKIANGAIKGGVVAGTTAVETVAGVIDGLIEGAYELGRQISENGVDYDFSEVIGKGVNNFTARTMSDIQKMSEEWFPNYRTEEERSEQYQRDWLKHIFTANFIGDSFLKNFGFTVGAIGGGAVWSKAIGSALRAGVAGNLMKGVTAAAEGNAEARAALENSLKLIDGVAAQTVDEAQLIKNITGASRALNRMNAKQQLFGAVIGAMGEGTMEGVMARDEFMNDYTERLNNEYLASREAKRNELINSLEGTEYVKRVPVWDESGNLTFVSELNDRGEAILAKEYDKLANDYYSKRNYSEEQGDKIAASTFLLNLPILTASNTIQFGRLFSGEFKTARNAAKVTGGITKDAGKVTANYAVAGNKAAKAIGKSLKVGTSEASEEMMQGFVSSGAKNVADARMTSFNDDGYDRKAMGEYGDWLTGMIEGGAEYLSDWKNWQEGFLGMVTGLIGMPGRRWSGGIPEAIREANEEIASSTAAATALNNRINSDKFQNAWKGYVRHLKYDNEMEEAIKNDDKYTWKTANDKQLISDIILFADAGRLQDLNDLVDTYANLTDEQAQELGVVEASSGEANKNEAQNNPEKIIAGVKDNAKAIKENIAMYNDMYNAMVGLAPVGTSEDQIKELIATSMNIRAFESRFLSMFDDVIKGLDKYIKPLSAVTKNGEEINTEEEKLERAKEIYNSLAQIFTGTEIPVDTPVVDALKTMYTIGQLEDAINLSGDSELKQKYNDMKKVAADRKLFLRKMLTLRDLDPVKFEEQKETPEKVVEEQKAIKAQEATKGLDTIDAVKKAYFSRNAKERIEFLNDLGAVEESNASVKSFLALKRRHDEFKGYLDKHGINVDDHAVTPPMVNSIVNDLVKRAKTEEELTSLPDSVFPSYEEFAKENSNIFGSPSEGTLFSIKQALRNAMNSYMNIDTATASRKSLSSTPVEQKPVTGAVSAPTGYDAAQPASLEPGPEVKDGKLAKEKIKEEEKPVVKDNTEKDVIVKNPTQEALLADASDAAIDYLPKGIDDEKVSVPGRKDKIAYYRTSIPEISTSEARKAREAINGGDRDPLKEIDLSDFPVNNPEYSEIWNALNDRGAFNNIATKLEVGDKIEFVVDPTFPTYNGQYQILLTIVKDGQRLTLNVLSGQTSKYYNLSELRKAIDGEYQKFKEEHPNDLFVFSQKSNVWGKRSGLIDYDYTGKEEKGIAQIESYNEDAPIVFINRNGNPVTVRGNADAATQVSTKFSDPSINRGDADGNDRRGNLYYLVRSDKDSYIPIRLNVEHFNEETIDFDNKIFDDIHTSIENITDIVKASNNTNLEVQNQNLHSELAKLIKNLDLNGIFFEIGDYENVGVALRVNDGKDSVIRRPDQITEEWLANLIAGYNRSIQVKLDNNKIQNLDKYIDNNILTSNARMLRPKGVDFYFDAWDAGLEEFNPATNAIAEVEREQSISEDRSIPAAIPADLDANFDHIFGDNTVMNSTAKGRTDRRVINESFGKYKEIPVQSPAEQNFDFGLRCLRSVERQYNHLPGYTRVLHKSEKLKNGDVRKGSVDVENKIIHIFVNDNDTIVDYEATVFHENLHAFLYSQGLTGDSSFNKRFVSTISGLMSIEERERLVNDVAGYEDEAKMEEIAVRIITGLMVNGKLGIVVDSMPTSIARVIKEYCKLIGYDIRTEENSRKSLSRSLEGDEDFGLAGSIYQELKNRSSIRFEGFGENKWERDSDYGSRVREGVERADTARLGFKDLPSSMQEGLRGKGYSEEEWKSIPEVLRDKILRCL